MSCSLYPQLDGSNYTCWRVQVLKLLVTWFFPPSGHFTRLWSKYSPQHSVLKYPQFMKNGVFWDVTPCGSCKNRRFWGTWRLLHQGDKNRWNRNNTWRMVSSGLLRRVTLVRTDVSEEPFASFIRVTKIGALGTTQAATSNRRTLVFLRSVRRLLVEACVVPISLILVSLMKEAPGSSETSVLKF
jgi:hypothetical protein